MKKALCILLLTGGLAASLIAEPTKLGLGIFLGQPSGVCVGLDLNAVNWLDFKAAWNFAGPADSVNIIAQAAGRLPAGGRLVINGVTGKTVAEAPECMAAHGLRVELTRMQIERTTYPETEPGKVLNPITVMTGRK